MDKLNSLKRKLKVAFIKLRIKWLMELQQVDHVAWISKSLLELDDEDKIEMTTHIFLALHECPMDGIQLNWLNMLVSTKDDVVIAMTLRLLVGYYDSCIIDWTPTNSGRSVTLAIGGYERDLNFFSTVFIAADANLQNTFQVVLENSLYSETVTPEFLWSKLKEWDALPDICSYTSVKDGVARDEFSKLVLDSDGKRNLSDADTKVAIEVYRHNAEKHGWDDLIVSLENNNTATIVNLTQTH